MITMYDIFMRTIIDLPDEQIEDLAEICKKENISRAALIRKAVSEFLQKYSAKKMGDAFGIWKNKGEDGLKYQRQIRSEWGE